MLTLEGVAREGSADAPVEAPPSLARRVWALPLWAHACAAFVLLALLIPVVGLDGSFSADEGAALIQAEQLAEGDGWIFEHPLPEVDPELDAFPLHNSEYGTEGIASYAKHPAYPLVLAGALAVGGMTGVLLLSILGTVAAAVVAGRLAGLLDPSLIRPAFWVTAVVSPLFFDGYVAMAHSLAAATAAGAVWFGLRAARDRRVMPAIPAGLCSLATVMLRTEGLFVGVALAAVFGVWWLRDRHPALLATAVGAGGAAVLGFVLDRLWWLSIIGTPGGYPTFDPRPGSPFPLARVRAFVYTWLQPSDNRAMGSGPLLLLVAVAILIAGTIIVRRRPHEQGAVGAFGVGAVAVAVIGALLTDPMGIPGLVVAFPVLFVGLVLVDRETLRSIEARVLLATAALFALAVLATQYEEGGSAEWGGRYFALGLPLAVPVALHALRGHGARLAPADRRVAVASLCAVSCLLSTMAIASLAAVHHRTAAVVATVDRTAADVVVTTVPALPRLAWQDLGDRPWLLIGPAERVPEYLDRLRDRGVDTIAYATRSFEQEERLLDGYEVVAVDDSAGFGWRIATVRLAA